MFSRKLKKLSSFKRFILKILNLYALEKETFNLINPELNNYGKNIYKINDKSILLSNGYLNLDRKIKKLDIYYRYAPNNSLWNSSGRWKRIVTNITKKDLILTSLISLKKSILKFLMNEKIEIVINLISDSSNEDFDKAIHNELKNDKIKIKFHESKVKGNRGSFLECCDQAEKADDLIFFIEDDYIFEEECITEMIYSYSRISSLLKKDIFLCPSDYPFYYDSNYQTSIFIGKTFRWRIVYETLLTFMMSKKLYVDYKKSIRKVGEQENHPFEKPLHGVYSLSPCLSPINSLSYHISRGYPAVTEDWLKVWNGNFKKYK